MSPVEQGRVPVRLIRDSSKLLVAPIPFDDERDQVVCGLFAAEVRLEHRCQVEGECLVLCAAWSIHCSVVLVSILISISVM